MGVVFEFLAFAAEFTVGVVVAFAVDVNHVGDGLSFTLHTLMFGVGGLRLHNNQLLWGLTPHKGLP